MCQLLFKLLVFFNFKLIFIFLYFVLFYHLFVVVISKLKFYSHTTTLGHLFFFILVLFSLWKTSTWKGIKQAKIQYKKQNIKKELAVILKLFCHLLAINASKMKMLTLSTMNLHLPLQQKNLRRPADNSKETNNYKKARN